MSISTIRTLLLAVALACAAPSALAASFVYEGRLDDLGQPANGRYDLRLTAYGHETQGATVAAPITFEGVDVRDGRFRLDVELPHVKGDQVWLEVAVRGAGEPMFAAIAGRSKAIAAPLIGACWSTTGDSGSNAAANFLGTIDAQPFVVRTRNVQSLRIEPSTILFGGNPITANIIAGSSANQVTAGVRGATIAGGGVPALDSDPNFFDEGPNRVTDAFGTVGGGYKNQAGDGAGSVTDRAFATVGGGRSNIAGGSSSTIGGGDSNTAFGDRSIVAGGNFNDGSGPISTVGGGFVNSASGAGSTVGGGQFNAASGTSSTVGGGFSNTASGLRSTVTGGEANCAGGDFSWAGGRRAKVRRGSSSGPPGEGCIGVSAIGETGDQGTFVWADSQDANFVSTDSNQFLIRAAGGAGFGTNSPQAALHVNGSIGGATALFSNSGTAIIRVRSDPTSSAVVSFNDTDGQRGFITAFTGGTLTIGSEGRVQMRTGGNTTRFQLSETGALSLARGPSNPDADKAIQIGTNTGNGNGAHLTNTGVWANGSSRTFKHAIEAIDPAAVLAGVLRLPVTRWSYIGDDAVRHLGPMAEDFHAAFGLGADARYIGTVDASGVALAAIQGLSAQVERERDALRAENAALRTRLDRLEAMLAHGLATER